MNTCRSASWAEGRGSQGRVDEQGRPEEVPGLGRRGGKHFGGALGLHRRPLRATCEMAGA